MGGFGSGPLPSSFRLFAEDLRRLDVGDLRNGQWPVRCGSDVIGTLAIRRQDDLIIGGGIVLALVRRRIGIATKTYVRCPVCASAVRVLFVADVIGCRQCTCIRYGSQHRAPHERNMAAAARAWRAANDADVELGADHVPRPPRRHRRRHARLDATFQAAMAQCRSQLRQHVLGLRDTHARLVARAKL